jgi:hypothetical protein
MELSGEWCYGVKRWPPLNQRERRTVRWCVREMRRKKVRESGRHVIYRDWHVETVQRRGNDVPSTSSLLFTM